ncbi:MAG TPA: hypothetical protein VEJ36_05765 [Nitrososphaerales archaeon]|nr:hypothetical protein [Nitrososphaerales archaeon]
MRPGVKIELNEAARLTMESLKTGSTVIDRILGGGVRSGALTQVYGSSSSGKTQLGLQTAVLAASSGASALVLDTEGSFRPERAAEIATARGLEPGPVLERITYVRSATSAEQVEVVRRLARGGEGGPKLVVVDTVTKNFTLDYPGRENAPLRQAELGTHMSEMARDAFLNSRAYLLANRVASSPSGENFVGGAAIEQTVETSLRLSREGDRVRVDSASGGSGVTSIGAAGIY